MSGKYALIIANSEYSDPGLAQLTAPGKDAEYFARVLEDRNLCGFDSVTVLMNQTSSSVIEAIDEFYDQKKPDDLLILYFSGHGVRDELGALYLAVKNTSRTRLRSTAIKSDYIREVMDQSRSKRQVLIMDCCNSGAFAQGTKAATGVSIGTATAFEAGYGRIILTASDSTQFAWEGDKVIGETDNSLFTHFLVKGLEGDADLDSDGRITVDELYDYAYEQVKLATPKQTPSKFSSKQQGEILLRQITRVEDIKPVALPPELVDEVEDSRTYVREAAVQQLEKLLKGRNIGLARSAREMLAKIAGEDDSRRVSQAAMQVLESFRLVEEKAEAERKAREEAERLATLRAEEERLMREKAEAERKAREETEKLQRAKAQREAAEREAARLKAEREAAETAAREAAEKAAIEKAEKEAAEREAAKAAEREAVELAARKKAEREAAERAEREALNAAARKRAEREAKEGLDVKTSKSVPAPWLKPSIIGVVVIAVILCGFASLNYLAGIFGGPATPEGPALTEPPVTEVPATEAPVEGGPLSCAPSGIEPISFPTGGKSITGALDFEPAHIVPYFDGSFSTGTIAQLTLVGLAEWDENGTFVPELAAEIPTAENGGISPDGLTITWKLRDCLFWSDGEPITSVDVRFTWDFIMDPNSNVLSQYGYDTIASVETPDDLTVVITFSELFPAWPVLFTKGPYNTGSILPEHILAGQTAAERDEFVRTPLVASGPFVVTEWISGDSITLLPNPNFYKGRAELDQIKIRFVPDNTSALSALQTGEIDWFPNFSEYDIPTVGALEPNVHLLVVPGPDFEHYFFNMGRPEGIDGRGKADNEGFCPFKDIRVRKAITLGIDRQRIIDNAVFNGMTIVPSSPWFNSYWANTNLQAQSYDPDAAQALLDEAGYTDSNGDGIREGFCNGNYTELSFRFETTTAQLRVDVASAVESDLAEIGILFNPIHTPAGTFFGAYTDGGPIATGQYDMAGYTTGFYPDPYTDNLSCESIPSASQPDGTNWYQNCDPYLSDLMEAINQTADPEARKAILEEVQNYLFDNYYIILMYARTSVYGHTDRFVPSSFGPLSGMNWNAEDWDTK